MWTRPAGHEADARMRQREVRISKPMRSICNRPCADHHRGRNRRKRRLRRLDADTFLRVFCVVVPTAPRTFMPPACAPASSTVRQATALFKPVDRVPGSRTNRGKSNLIEANRRFVFSDCYSGEARIPISLPQVTSALPFTEEIAPNRTSPRQRRLHRIAVDPTHETVPENRMSHYPLQKSSDQFRPMHRFPPRLCVFAF